MDDETRWEQISAALDDEAEMPTDLDADERAFVARAAELRSLARVAEARRPPDVTAAVLQRIPASTSQSPRRLALAAVVVFLVAAVAGVLAVRPGGPGAHRPAAAEIAGRVIEGQRAVTSFDAAVTVVERGVHPDIPVRTLIGRVRYEAPEQFRIHLEQQTPAVEEWPSNDIDIQVTPGRAALEGLDDCPVAAQPDCLQPAVHRFSNLPPFSPTWVSPLDLIVPADAFLPVVDTAAAERDGRVIVDTTVARVDQLLDGLTSAGAIRSVHATDLVRLELDADTLTLRRLTVRAADNLARSTWAATNGYPDPLTSEILVVEVDPTSAGVMPDPPIASARVVSAGFTDAPLDPAWPPPAGFTLHRTGILEDGGPRTEVYTYSDGRAWLRIDVTDAWEEPRLFGGLGPLVRSLPLADGVGYTDPAGTKVAVRGVDRDVVVTGSVDLEDLASAAASTIPGVPIDDDWAQANQVEEIPDGALIPPGDHLAVLDDGDLVIAVGGPGATGVVLTQRPATELPPPVKGDVVETVVRGVPGRYSPRLGTLTWLDHGWQRELRGDGRDQNDLETVAASLVAR